MASAQNSAGGETGSRNLTTVVVPVAGVALIVILVIVIAATSESTSGTGKEKKKGDAEKAEMLMKADASTLMDGTRPGADDPGLKAIGSQGLMIRDEKEGTGSAVPHGASVEIYYTGWLKDGSVFDSSARRNETINFSLTRLIPGWQQGIPGMKPGGVRKLVVPPELGYGSDARPGIPANSTLVFEVQLVSFK